MSSAIQSIHNGKLESDLELNGYGFTQDGVLADFALLSNANITAIGALTTTSFGRGVLEKTSGNILTYIGAATAAQGAKADTAVQSVSVASANGVSGSSSGGATPALTIALGAITPASVTAVGAVTGSNLSGTNTGDQTITISGDGSGSGTGAITLVISNLPAGTTAAGRLLATAIAAPVTPSAGIGSIYVDSTSKNLAVKDDAGVVKHGVQTKATVTSNFLTAISDAGVVSAAQPAFTDISGSVAAAQMPALTGDVTTSAGAVATTLATVATGGTTGSSTAIPVITINAKGLTTSITTAAVVAPAGTLSGATLASGVTASSLTSFGASPTLVTPILGTPTSGTLTNCTFPTLNQNTSGSAASLSVSGQTGLITLTGIASTSRIKTVRDAADTILELGGSYTPSGTWTNLTLVTPTLGTPASGTVTNLTGTASININGTVGATTPAAGTFTTLVAGSTTSLLLGTAGSAVGNIGFRNATSGTATLAPPTGALGSYSVTLPNAASTLPIFGQQITFSGPTAARTVTLPDASFTAARTDAANTFIGVQTMTSAALTTPAIAGGTATGLTGLAIRSTGAAFDLTFATSEVLTAGRTLSFNVGDAARTLTVFGSSTVPVFSQQITFSGPTAARTVTLPDASFTAARTDAANTFTGVQTMTSPALTTPAITGLATGSGVASAATASTLVARDANVNVTANNWLGGYTTTATAAGTTTLTVGSTYVQFFTGVTTQTVTLPVASTLTLGHQFVIVNNSTGAVTVNSSGANAVLVMAGGTSATFTCILASGTTAASWNTSYFADAVASGKKLTVSNTLTLAGTDATTMTFPTTSATIARTDAANTFTGHQTVEGVTSTGATGTGKFVFDGSPTLVTPALGAATATSVAIGGGAAILKVMSATATLAFPSTAAGGSFSDLTMTVTGAAVNDDVSLGVPAAAYGSGANVSYVAWVSATNTVTVRLINNDRSADEAPASATFRATVTHF